MRRDIRPFPSAYGRIRTKRYDVSAATMTGSYLTVKGRIVGKCRQNSVMSESTVSGGGKWMSGLPTCTFRFRQRPIWFAGRMRLVSDPPSCNGSVFTLRSQLDHLYTQTNEQLNQAAPRPVSQPTAEKPGLMSRLLRRGPRQAAPLPPALAETARSSLDIFRNLATRACEHRLPMLLHY